MTRIDRMNWTQYRNCAEQGLVILPVGSTEQHALHLPLGVDTLLAERFSMQLAERVGAYVAPTLAYGYKSQPSSGGGPLFPGTIDLGGETVINLVRDILTELIDDGWTRILILNAHFENQAFLMEAADLVQRHRQPPCPRVMVTSWYDHVSPDVIPKVWNELPFPGWELEHAAILETSAMLYYAPELVDTTAYRDEGLDALPKYAVFPPAPDLVPAYGGLAPARTSSAEKGRLMVESALDALVPLVRREFALKP